MFRHTFRARVGGMFTDIKGTHVQSRTPNWEPLIDLVDEPVVASFMWMAELELDDGRRIHAYKHRLTRRYLHLAEDGAAFLYTQSGLYRRVPVLGQLAIVLYEWHCHDAEEAPDAMELRPWLRAMEALDAAPG